MNVCRAQFSGPCGSRSDEAHFDSGEEHKTSLHPRLQGTSALTLLEMMVAVTLLVVIMLGLLAMFNQTQKALHVVNTQTDVFENARGAIQMITRDLSEMTLYPNGKLLNSMCYADAFPSPIPQSSLPLPSVNLPVRFTETFWLTRVNDEWQGVGYFVLDDTVLRTNYGVGSLYRFSGNGRQSEAPLLVKSYTAIQPTNTHRISDGIVHFKLSAAFVTNYVSATRTNISYYSLDSFDCRDVLPAFVDVEIGVLEPQALKQFQALQDLSLPRAKDFLRDHAGQVHFFRERVPIRNFVNPYREHELP